MKGSTVVKLVFGVMGAVFTLIGAICLTIAVDMVGDVRRIFRLPEDDLALSIVGVVFAVLGVVFLLVTVLLILSGIRHKRLRGELLQYGARVTGVITEVWMDTTVQVNGRSPLRARVRCSFPAGEVTLKSKRLWDECPSTGDKVDVIYDPMDEKRYIIEFPGEK